MPVTVRFQSTGRVPGDGRPVPMVGPSMTIGRGDENDLVLPDPDKMVSKRHCAIEEQGGGVVVIDFSTNGTFLNYDKVPIGKAPTPLNDGDILSVGPYELVVEIPPVRAASPADLPPLETGPVSPGQAGRVQGFGGMDDPGGGDFLDDLLGPGGPSGPSSVRRPGLDDMAGPGAHGLLPPLDDDFLNPKPAARGPAMPDHLHATEDAFRPPRPQAQAIPDDWDDLFAPTPAAAPPRSVEPPRSDEPPRSVAPPKPIPEDPFVTPPPAPLPKASPFDEPEPPPPPRRSVPEPAPEMVAPQNPVVAEASPDTPPHARAAAAAAVQTAPAGAAEAFLLSAGLSASVPPGTDLPSLMGRLGGVFRTMVEGLREVLMARAALKSEFRIEATMIASQGNNPLKFSISPEQALEAMVRPVRGYLPAETAAREALDDIKAHEVAMVTGMEAALKGVLARMAPEKIEARIAGEGGLGSMFGSRKARYWEAYEELYGEIAEQAETEFHELFAREFARAYQAQLTRLRAGKNNER